MDMKRFGLVWMRTLWAERSGHTVVDPPGHCSKLKVGLHCRRLLVLFCYNCFAYKGVPTEATPAITVNLGVS